MHQAHRLSEPERARLVRRYAAERRPSDLETLVISYRPLARALARRYSSPSVPDADLEQAACEGLIKALQRFDPDQGASFTNFAVPTILGQVRRYLRDTAWPAHVPRPVQERVRSVRHAVEALSARDGRVPTAREIARRLGEAEEDVVEALAASASLRTVPLDVRRGDDDSPSPVERLGGEDPGYDRVECLVTIAGILPHLRHEQLTVLAMHFDEDLTQRQIAARLGMSRSNVGRLLNGALDTLRAAA
jgi:RNA polymerase sigma-B factor